MQDSPYSLEFIHLEDKLYNFEGFLQVIQRQSAENLLFHCRFSNPILKIVFDVSSQQKEPPLVEPKIISQFLHTLRDYNRRQLQEEACYLFEEIDKLQSQRVKIMTRKDIVRHVINYGGSQHLMLDYFSKRIAEQGVQEIPLQEVRNYLGKMVEDGIIQRVRLASSVRQESQIRSIVKNPVRSQTQAEELLNHCMQEINKILNHVHQSINDEELTSSLEKLSSIISHLQDNLRHHIITQHNQLQRLQTENEFLLYHHKEKEELIDENEAMKDTIYRLQDHLDLHQRVTESYKEIAKQHYQNSHQQLKLKQQQYQQLLTVFNLTINQVETLTRRLDQKIWKDQDTTFLKIVKMLMIKYKDTCGEDHLKRCVAAINQLDLSIERSREHWSTDQSESYQSHRPNTIDVSTYTSLPQLSIEPIDTLSFTHNPPPPLELEDVRSNGEQLTSNYYQQLSINTSVNYAFDMSLYQHRTDLAITPNHQVAFTFPPPRASASQQKVQIRKPTDEEVIGWRLVFQSKELMRRFQSAVETVRKMQVAN